MYLDLLEKPISETGETYDYANTNQWVPKSVKRQGTSRNNSARSSGSSMSTCFIYFSQINLC